MDGGFGDDVGVETVAQVNRVDVVTANEGAPVSDLQREARKLEASFAPGEEANSPFQIAVHDGEEHLEEEVDGVDQHRQQVQPRFTGHDECEIDKKSIPAETRIEDGQRAVVRRRRRSAMRGWAVRGSQSGIGDGSVGVRGPAGRWGRITQRTRGGQRARLTD